MAQVEILGIRHHGPGSARSVAAALAELAPDRVLIEGVPELDALLPLAGSPELIPPVAGLVYDPTQPRSSMFYPMAAFSPEWVALRWAVSHGIQVSFADLAATHQLALSAAALAEAEAAREADLDEAEPDEAAAEADAAEPEPARRPDLISQLAQVAGYSDPERWWDDAVEHRHDSALADFKLLLEAVTLARAAHDEELDLETSRREAAMRRSLRGAIKSGAERIAFICGAFHAPALVPDSFPSQVADNRLLSGLPKAKVAATWAPWTSARLAYESGYGAGVSSPGWYSHLFDQWSLGNTEVAASWLVQVAHQLRKEDLDAAPATVVEATRLAESLAALRGRPSVGLSELNDAALVTLAGGSEIPLELIRTELVVGHELGQVPAETPMVPLAADLAAQQRRLRLKPAALAADLVLDLRKEAGLARSVLFHRLALLGIPWAVAQETGRTTGTFKELWRVEWQPEFAVRLIEAGVHGNTVASAASSLVVEQAAQNNHLAELADLLEASLLAQLPDALSHLVARLDQTAAQHADVPALLKAIAPLARTLRYGDVRGLQTGGLDEVVHAMVARCCVGLRAACASLDDAAAVAMRAAIESANDGVAVLNDAALSEPWLAALDRIADESVHGSVAGRATRMLLDAGRLDSTEVAARLSRELSRARPAPLTAAWLDGFLTGDALLLLHDPALLILLDGWLAEVPEQTFEDLLPLLRRTFSRYQAGELRQIGEKVTHLDQDQPRDQVGGELDSGLAWPAMVRVAELLGLEVAR